MPYYTTDDEGNRVEVPVKVTRSADYKKYYVHGTQSSIFSSYHYRIDERNIEQLLAKFRDGVLRQKMEDALWVALNKISEKFADLVAEVHATENFVQGEATGQYNLLVIINQEQYSVIEIILKLADAIFGPLFLETGLLFGLTVLSEQEWGNLRASGNIEVTNTLGKTVRLLSTGVKYAK